MWVVIQLVIGLVLLVVGAEWLVRGASRLAQAFGVSPLVIGLTVVAFGTSAPELAVSAFASYQGNADIALGNVVGSNIFNVLIILGISAVVMPLVVHTQLIRLDVPLMIAVSGLVYLLALDGTISRLEGIGLFVGIILYTWLLIYLSRRETKEAQAEFSSNSPEIAPRKFGLWIDLFIIVAGLAALMVGSKFLIDSSTKIALALGISELIIGLTIVAAGTSLPELATSVVAAYRGQRDIAVGNVVGSNIFNILSVLGVSAILGQQGVAVSATALNFDIPVMIAVAVMCFPVFYTGYIISRGNGVLFLAYYVAYVTYLILQQYQLPVLETFKNAMLWFVIPPTVATILALAVWQWRKNRVAA
jgi:cation:H+ antiporter